MEREELINPGLAIFVMECNLREPSPFGWIADGTPIDGYHGFGDDEIRSFDGEVALLSFENKLIQYISISLMHFSRGGFKWRINETEFLPQPPFLISSDLAIEIIFNGNVEMSESPEDFNFSEPDSYVYSVATRNWFGIMKLEGDNQVHLVAFSSKKDVTVAVEDELWTFEWDCLFGTIKRIL